MLIFFLLIFLNCKHWFYCLSTICLSSGLHVHKILRDFNIHLTVEALLEDILVSSFIHLYLY